MCAARCNRDQPSGTFRGFRLILCGAALLVAGCEQMMRQTDRDVATMIRERQRAALGGTARAEAGSPELPPSPDRSVRAHAPRPTTRVIPPDFAPITTQPASAPASQPVADALAAPAPAPTPATRRERVFTLTDALGYAQQYQREYQTAKEELYLVALALSLERHLWTPIFASQFQTVYGNYGEARNFDQAMRFVADLSVSQRLPYGGEVTAKAISTLIRDVKQAITASEGSNIALGLKVPLLRGAGHVAQENLIKLERELTYAVRVFERYRRQQLVNVAQAYFDLLRAKQQVTDSEQSLERAIEDYERARDMEVTGQRSALDTQRAELAMLDARNTVEQTRESFRAQTDQFKLKIGMPLDEALGRDDLEDIDTIERQIDAGTYPLLAPSPAMRDEARAVTVACRRRLDLLTTHDQVDDARRGVEISRNAMLPNLNWDSSLTFQTDPQRYSLSHFHVDSANWLSQLTFELPLERTAERNALRVSLIQVRAAQRAVEDQTERIRAEVRRIVNQLRLQETALEIQRRSVDVADRQREFAQYQFEEGKIDNRDKVDAERALLAAQNALNQAKTGRWGLLLQFRLATETLLIDEDGVQQPETGAPPDEAR